MANQYVFLPWLRRGLANEIAEPDPLAGENGSAARAGVQVRVKIMADDTEHTSVNQKVSLVGPGDIVGINRSAIVKTEPAAGTKNFEPNFFPYIEFYEEDFPWRYSPAKAAGEKRLRPWLSLIVLEEPEFDRAQGKSTATSQIVRITSDPVTAAFPPASQIWAWAHVQINDGGLIANELIDTNQRSQKVGSALSANPNVGVSRLLCPRKLQPNTKYHAFVVPSFERGRIAGLGGTKEEIEQVGQFVPSWEGDGESKNIFPVYYEWSFVTGEEDFEALAKKIVPRDLTGSDVGRLWMDASDINYGELFDYKGNLEPGNSSRNGFLPFEGALRLPAPPTPNFTQRDGENEKEFVDHFSKLINLGVQYRQKTKTELQWSIDALGAENDDPLLVPPIYGRWYIKNDGDATVDPSLNGNWLEQLNLDPALRVAAGLGAEVIRENQEEYMSRSWEQLADNRRKLNIELQRLRFSQEVTKAVFDKHFAGGGATENTASNVLALTQSLHAFVKSDQAELSVAGRLAAVKTDAAFIEPVYRRVTRLNGPVMKRIKTAKAQSMAVTSLSTQFTVLSFHFVVDPPFQNFNSRLVEQFDPKKFPILLGGILLNNPNWFGGPIVRFMFDDGPRFQNVLMKDLLETVLRKPVLTSPPAFDFNMLTAKMLAKIQPAQSFRAIFRARLPENAPEAVTESDGISPNTFNPVFADPTYEELGKLRPDLFIPNLEKIEPDSFVLLQANSAFIEAYLVGINHELGSEFLWRGFPADMNATFFRQFWDVSDSMPTTFDKSDIKPIRFWPQNNSLGKNGPEEHVENPLVFVIKAELVRKYPNLVIYAQKAKLGADGFRRPDTEVAVKLPIFISSLNPDFLFAGFDLTKDQVQGLPDAGAEHKDGWYFVIAERPGEMHFGLDQARDAGKPFAGWNDFAWTDLPDRVDYVNLEQHVPSDPDNKNGLEWGKGENPLTSNALGGTGDAAQMAALLQQRPVQMFVHATLLVK